MDGEKIYAVVAMYRDGTESTVAKGIRSYTVADVILKGLLGDANRGGYSLAIIESADKPADPRPNR